MKVKLISESVQHNPDFDKTIPIHPTDNHPLRKLPVGTIVSGPDAYLLCLVNPQMAEPVDDEAVQKIKSINPSFFDDSGKTTVEIPKSDEPATPTVAKSSAPKAKQADAAS